MGEVPSRDCADLSARIQARWLAGWLAGLLGTVVTADQLTDCLGRHERFVTSQVSAASMAAASDAVQPKPAVGCAVELASRLLPPPAASCMDAHRA